MSSLFSALADSKTGTHAWIHEVRLREGSKESSKQYTFRFG